MIFIFLLPLFYILLQKFFSKIYYVENIINFRFIFICYIYILFYIYIHEIVNDFTLLYVIWWTDSLYYNVIDFIRNFMGLKPEFLVYYSFIIISFYKIFFLIIIPTFYLFYKYRHIRSNISRDYYIIIKIDLISIIFSIIFTFFLFFLFQKFY